MAKNLSDDSRALYRLGMSTRLGVDIVLTVIDWIMENILNIYKFIKFMTRFPTVIFLIVMDFYFCNIFSFVMIAQKPRQDLFQNLSNYLSVNAQKTRQDRIKNPVRLFEC